MSEASDFERLSSWQQLAVVGIPCLPLSELLSVPKIDPTFASMCLPAVVVTHQGQGTTCKKSPTHNMRQETEHTRQRVAQVHGSKEYSASELARYQEAEIARARLTSILIWSSTNPEAYPSPASFHRAWPEVVHAFGAFCRASWRTWMLLVRSVRHKAGCPLRLSHSGGQEQGRPLQSPLATNDTDHPATAGD